MWSGLRKLLLANPMGVFIYGIIGKWYILITIAALVVTFWVFKGLEQAWVMASVSSVVTQSLNEVKSVAKNCTPKITNLSIFWDCLVNPPEYAPSSDDASAKTLEENLNKPLNQVIQKTVDPYDESLDNNHKHDSNNSH